MIDPHVKLWISSRYGRYPTCVTLDCLDGNHVACIVCSCFCHFKDVEEFTIMSEISKLNAEFNAMIRRASAKASLQMANRKVTKHGYTPRHMKGSKMGNMKTAARLSLIVVAAIFTACIIVGAVYVMAAH